MSRYQELEEVCNLFIEIYEYNVLTRLDSLAHDYYETIRWEKGSSFTTTQGVVDFYSYLSRHDQGLLWWPDIGSEYYELEGENRYSQARETLLNILSLANVNDSDTDAIKIMKILSFGNIKVDYESDINDAWFAPTETLSSGTGDCEDYSILFSALFELADIDSAIVRVTNSDGDRHAMVLVHLPVLEGFNYLPFSDLTDLGLSSGTWILLEPQRSSYDHFTGLSQWVLVVAAET